MGESGKSSLNSFSESGVKDVPGTADSMYCLNCVRGESAAVLNSVTDTVESGDDVLNSVVIISD